MTGKRLLAGLIDYAVIWAFSQGVTLFITPALTAGMDTMYQRGGQSALDSFATQAMFQAVVLGFVMSLAYFAGLEAWRGATLGMGMAGLSIRGASGAAPTLEQSVKRSAFLSLLLPVTGVIELVVLATTGSTIGDRLSGTSVVLRQAVAPEAVPSPTDAEGAALEGDAAPCPFCAETIKKAAVKCKHCGSELELGWAAPVPTSDDP